METNQSQQRLILLKSKLLIIANIVFGLTCAYAQQERLIATVEVITQKMELEGATPQYLNIRGWAFYELGKYEKAILDYQKALILDSTDHELYFRLAEIEYDSGVYQSSISNYSKAIKLAPDSLSYRISRGVASEKMQLYKQALEDYNYVLENEPYNKLALVNRANLYFGVFNDYKKSLNDWTKLINTYGGPRFYNDRALVYSEMQLYKNAMKDLTDAILIDNQNSIFFFNRGFAYGMAGNTRKAFSDFNKAMKLDSLNPYLYKLRGEVYLKIGKTKRACKDFYHAKKLKIDVEEYLNQCSKH